MGGKGRAQKKLADIKKQAAGAWTREVARRTRITQFSDLAMESVVMILSFLTKRVGSATYFDDGLHHLNTVCRQWYCWLEHARYGSGPGIHASLHSWVHERMGRTTNATAAGPRSNPVSPAVAPLHHTPTDGAARPTVLVLSDLATPIPETTHAAELGLAGCKDAITKHVAAGGCKAGVVHWVMSNYRMHRSGLNTEKAYLAHVKAADAASRRKEVAKLSELIRWCVQELEVDLSVVDKNARSLLHYACMFNDAASAKLLMQNGAGLQGTDRHGQTPLHVAASNGCQEIIQGMLNKPDTVVAQVLAKKDAHGRTPLECASKFHHVHCSQAISKRLRGLTNKVSESRDAYDEDEETVAYNRTASSPTRNANGNGSLKVVNSTSLPSPSAVSLQNDSLGSNSSGSNCDVNSSTKCTPLDSSFSTPAAGNGNGSSTKAAAKKKKQRQAQSHFDAADLAMFAYDDRHW